MTHETHSKEAWLKTAAAVIFGVSVLLLSVVVERLAGWTWIEILKSVAASFVILGMALIRVKARTRSDAGDRLWITALAAWLTNELATWAANFHAAEQAEAEAQAKAKAEAEAQAKAEAEAQAGQARPAPANDGADPAHAPAPQDRPGPVPAAPSAVTERDGTRVLINGVWRDESWDLHRGEERR